MEYVIITDTIKEMVEREEYIVFDVGANWGTDSLQYMQYKNIKVYAFEPVPEMAEYLRKRSRNYPNYEVIECAVSDKEGYMDFYVSKEADWGSSSLYEFSENIEKTWPGRKDFKVSEKIKVKVITLKNFIKERNIKKIDYYHSDAQGSDILIMRGIPRIINRGVIEISRDESSKLYKNGGTYNEAEEYMRKEGYEIIKVISNDEQNNELNVYFKRK